MKKLEKAAVLLELIKELRKNNSWCGETNIQKSVYVLQAIFGNDLGYSFILYKHGPYSFDLKESLTAMRADKVLDLESHIQYGPRFMPGENSEFFKNHYTEVRENYKKKLNFIASKLGKYKVSELEKLATALYVWKKQENSEIGDTEIAKRINELKKHISIEEATSSIKEVRQLIKEAKELLR
jgi:hypothetical protein